MTSMHSTSPVSSMRLEPRRRKRKNQTVEKNAGLLGARWHIRSDWVASGFRQFGEHCARNQIRVLLIDCFVMTNLFYPALTLYLTKRYSPPETSASGSAPSRDGTFSLLSQPLLSSFFPYPPPLLPRLQVDRGRWWDTIPSGNSTWQASKVSRKGKERARDTHIAVLRTAWTTVDQVLDGGLAMGYNHDEDMVAAIRSLASEWSSIGMHGESCVQEWWRETEHCIILPTDSDAAQDGMFRTMSVLLHSADSTSSASLATRWRSELAARTASLGGEVFAESRDYALRQAEQDAQIWSLSLNTTLPSQPTLASTETPGTPPLILALYAVLILTLLRQLSDATKVHSRFGLAFTGVMELACSTVMSFSILGLMGWSDTGSGTETGRGLPVYMMPFVIVVVGVENMSTLTKAVFSIPFSYSVPDRIGLALAKVGATLTLTSLADMALLAIVGFFVNIRAVREFCLFAGIVIFVDWWMLHTFFLTVLSIDAQRLELADVLQAPDVPVKERSREVAKPLTEGSLKSIGTGFKAVIMGRTARSFSLILLLVFLSGLLYVTDTTRTSPMSTANLYGYWPSTSPTGSTTLSTSPSATTAHELESMSMAEQLWIAINPSSKPSIDIVIPPAAIVVLPTEGHVMRPVDLKQLSLPRRRIILPRIKPLFSFIKIFILPQALTAGSLYLLLLYLLKDADLLDAQRHRLGRGEEAGQELLRQEQASLTSGMRFNLLPPEHQADIELLSVSADGSVVVSVDFDSSVRLWRAASDDTLEAICETLAAPAPPHGYSDPIIKLAVSGDGAFVAAATVSGRVISWSTVGNAPPLVVAIDCGEPSSRVAGLAIMERDGGHDDPFTAVDQNRITVAVALSDGSVYETVGNRIESVYSPSTSIPLRVELLSPQSGTQQRLAVSEDDTIVISKRSHNGSWEEERRLDSKPFSSIAVADLMIGESPWLVFAVGYADGSSALYDGMTGELIDTLQGDDITRGSIGKIEIIKSDRARCTTCGMPFVNGFHIASSTRQHVIVDRVTFRHESASCKCSSGRFLANGVDSSLLSPSGHVPRSDGGLVLPPSPLRVRSSPSASPRKQNSLLPPTQGDFPISAHGYTRRLSAMHRDAETDEVTQTQIPRSPLLRNSSLDFSLITDSSASSPKWSDVTVKPLGAVSADKGDWAVVDGQRIVGVRRGRSRAGFDLEWQVWVVDLLTAWDGQCLRADVVAMSTLAEQTVDMTRRSIDIADEDGPDVSLRHRRARRLLSLTGSSSGRSAGRLSSASLVRPPSLSYHSVWPVTAKGTGIVAGFGNRLGVALLPKRVETPSLISPGLTPRSNGSAYPFPSTPSSLPPPPPPASKSRRASVDYTLGTPRSKQL